MPPLSIARLYLTRDSTSGMERRWDVRFLDCDTREASRNERQDQLITSPPTARFLFQLGNSHRDHGKTSLDPLG